MKKTATKRQRNVSEEDVAIMDLPSEFEGILDNSFLDEDALAEAIEDED